MEAANLFKEEIIMAMVVQHNLTAMNANRQLGVTTSGQSKSSEKLSSGYRINRAGDDAGEHGKVTAGESRRRCAGCPFFLSAAAVFCD